MELTNIQNSALSAVQQTPSKGSWRNRQKPAGADTTETLPTIHTSVGAFAIRSTRVGCYLELIMGKVHRVLGLYKTNEAAIEALINHRTGFRMWNALDAGNAKTELDARAQ